MFKKCLNKITLIALTLVACDVLAINKCVVAGKTTYQASPCADESQGGEVKGLKIKDNEVKRSEAARKKLDEEIAGKNRIKVGQKISNEQSAAINRMVRKESEMNAITYQILNDNTAKELAESAMKLHRMAGE